MTIGSHFLVDGKDPEAGASFRGVLGSRSIAVGAGGLIFAGPPAAAGIQALAGEFSERTAG